MRELDLIPASYRRARQQRRWLTTFLTVTGVIVAVLVSARAGIEVAVARVSSDVQILQQQQTISVTQRDELQRLTDQRADYQNRLRLLAGLRSGTSAEQLFDTVEATLIPEELWFLNWQFRRAGMSDGDHDHAVETGYFLVLPEGQGGSKQETWQVETHMEINGQAKDHAALSDFVKRLFNQHEVFDVRVKRTELRRYRARTVVDFDLAVMMNTRVAVP